MISIRIDAEEAGRALTVLGANLGNLTDPITKLLDLGLEDGRANLESRGVMFNEGWAIMSPWTTKVAKALYGKVREPLDVLEDTGALLLSLVKDAPFNIFEVGDGEGEAGSGYLSTRTGFGVAVAMQYGTTRTYHVLGDGGFTVPGIPGRPFLSWHDERGDEYAGIFAEHALAGVNTPEA